LKKTALVLVISAVAVLIVLPALQFVNQSHNHSLPVHRILRADGAPRPVPLPNPPEMGTDVLVADGAPRPVPLPPGMAADSLIADGAPRPVPLPPSMLSTFLV
jgi:hypothetical protein